MCVRETERESELERGRERKRERKKRPGGFMGNVCDFTDVSQ